MDRIKLISMHVKMGMIVDRWKCEVYHILKFDKTNYVWNEKDIKSI